MQKSYTLDCLTHKRVSNKDAVIPKYYKKGHHEPIIDEKTYMLAQIIMMMQDRHRGGMQFPFYGFLKCPFCGEDMLRLRLPSRNFEPAWFCREKCEIYAVKDKYIHSAVMEAYEKTGQTAPSKTVEYKFLYDYVDSITFQKNGDTVDWNTLAVTWKGGNTTTGSVVYTAPSDTPCTKLEEKDGWVIINGVPITKVKHAAECVRRVNEFVKNTVIEEGGDVPIVLAPNSVKGQKRA